MNYVEINFDKRGCVRGGVNNVYWMYRVNYGKNLIKYYYFEGKNKLNDRDL